MSSLSPASHAHTDVLFREIESDDFAASLGIASTQSVFKELLAAHPKVSALLEEVSSDANLISVLINRIRSIEQIGQDPAYSNPYDAALAAYLWILNSKVVNLPKVARFAASEILKINDLWWSRNLALEVLGGENEIGHVSSTIIPVSFGEDEAPRLRHRSMTVLAARNRAITNFASSLEGSLRLVRGDARFGITISTSASKWTRRHRMGLTPKRSGTRILPKEAAWSK